MQFLCVSQRMFLEGTRGWISRREDPPAPVVDGNHHQILEGLRPTAQCRRADLPLLLQLAQALLLPASGSQMRTSTGLPESQAFRSALGPHAGLLGPSRQAADWSPLCLRRCGVPLDPHSALSMLTFVLWAHGMGEPRLLHHVRTPLLLQVVSGLAQPPLLRRLEGPKWIPLLSLGLHLHLRAWLGTSSLRPCSQAAVGLSGFKRPPPQAPDGYWNSSGAQRRHLIPVGTLLLPWSTLPSFM